MLQVAGADPCCLPPRYTPPVFVLTPQREKERKGRPALRRKEPGHSAAELRICAPRSKEGAKNDAPPAEPRQETDPWRTPVSHPTIDGFREELPDLTPLQAGDSVIPPGAGHGNT